MLVLSFAWASMCLVDSTPGYFVEVANRVLRLEGGPRLGPDLGVKAVSSLEQQVKRVLGADPSLDLNVSSVRDLPDEELLRILFLAVLGNFTSAGSGEWQQPCRLVVDTRNGLVRLSDTPQISSLALKVVVALLVAVQFKQWITEVRAKRQAEEAHPPSNAKTEDQKGKSH